MWTQGLSRKCDRPYKKMYLRHTISGPEVSSVVVACLCNLGHTDRPKSVYIHSEKTETFTHAHAHARTFCVGKI